MNEEEILDKAYIPNEMKSQCYITENGMIFTPLFDENDIMLKSGEEMYQDWLSYNATS